MIDTGAAPASQITPYVDGQPVAYTKLESGTGAGNFANSTLYLMSRAGSSLFGAGDLDELAVYTKALTAAQIQDHYSSFGTNRRPNAAFTISKNPVKPNASVTFNASGSSDPDGSIVRYQWDLDGNGSFETDTGTTPTVSKSYAAQGAVPISLRVIDNQGGTDVTTTTLVVGNSQPTASFTATPNPAVVSQTVTFDASASADPDGTVVKYEWDLDGNGTLRDDDDRSDDDDDVRGGSDDQRRSAGNRRRRRPPVRRRARCRFTAPRTATQCSRHAGLLDYWRLDETTGPTFADGKGASPATASGGVTFGVPGAFTGANVAARFDGTSGFAQTPLDLSATSTLTIEFWLKWSAYVDDDALAMEFTPNFNGNPGGFLVDPNASNGLFGVGIGSDDNRNDVFFPRPSAGVWHHYAFVIDTTAAAATQITPYVDGQPVSFSKLSNGTGAGAVCELDALPDVPRAELRSSEPGDLDEVAIYTQPLSAATIATHYADGAS